MFIVLREYFNYISCIFINQYLNFKMTPKILVSSFTRTLIIVLKKTSDQNW
jgi:hypothetical protein